MKKRKTPSRFLRSRLLANHSNRYSMATTTTCSTTIQPKQNRPITMMADQGRIIFWVTMIIIPLLLFGNGVRVWWKKR